MFSVYEGKCLSRKAVHIWVACSQKTCMMRVSRHRYSDWKRVSVLVEDMSRNNCFPVFEYHIFYVLHPFVTYLLTLPRNSRY
jgi:hypothetical protein